MDLVLGQFLAGLSYGSTLFLVSAGLTLIFGVTRVVNFAHGALYMLGAYFAITLTAALPATPLGFFGGLLIAALVVAAIGVVIEVVVLRRIYAAPEIFQLLATFGVALIVQDLALAAWGPEERFAPRAPGLKGAIEIGAALVPGVQFHADSSSARRCSARLWWVVRRHALGDDRARGHAGPRDGRRTRRQRAAGSSARCLRSVPGSPAWRARCRSRERPSICKWI